MDIVLNLNSTKNSIDVLKYCILYFDKVSVDLPYMVEAIEERVVTPYSNGRLSTMIHFTSYFSDAVLEAFHFLENEGLVIADKIDALRKHEFIMLAKDIVGDNLNLLFKKEDFEKRGRSVKFSNSTKLISEEAMEAISESLSEEKKHQISKYKFEGAQVPDFYLAMGLYTSLLELLLAHMSLGENTICNSIILNNMIDNSLNKGRKKERDRLKKLAMLNAMKILLPNISEASLEDILEVRWLAKDELIEMRAYIDSTLKELSNEEIYKMNPTDICRLVEQKITPSVNQFERKLQNIRLSSVQSFIKGIKNPLSYAPLITSFFAQVPAHITLSASLGLISFEPIIEYCKNKNDLKNDPLYFTVAINRMLG